MGTALARDHMRRGMGENFVAGAAMHQRCRDVAHCAGRQEDGGLLAEEICDTVAERDRCGIVTDLLVANIRARHRLTHARRRPGLGVGHQVDPDRRQLGIG